MGLYAHVWLYQNATQVISKNQNRTVLPYNHYTCLTCPILGQSVKFQAVHVAVFWTVSTFCTYMIF